MKLFRNTIAPITILIAMLCAGFALAESDARKSFDLLKGMEGN